MRNLYSYIYEGIIDGHIHTFNWEKSILDNINKDNKRISFIDIEYDCVEKYDFYNCYKNYIDNEYDEEKEVLLATAVNIEDIKKIYSEFPNVIKGFGELKCYSSYQDKQVPYKKISFVKQVCKFSNNCGNLPVYLHWEIENEKDIKILKNLLTQYPTVPIVLCHCGMNEFNKDYAYIQSNYLANQFENLWLDISYVALDYFYENQLKINTLPKHKIIFGTDVNNKLLGPGHDFPQEYDDKIFKMIKMMKYANSNNNLKRLFKGSL